MPQTPDSPQLAHPVQRAIASAPLPTVGTLRRRQSLPYQLWRFVLLNLRIMRMVAKGHG